MIMKELEKKKLENCGFCRAGLSHICKVEEAQELPAALHKFGAVSKAIQSTPKEEDKDKPKSKTYRGYGEIPFDLLKSPRTGFAFESVEIKSAA